MLAIESNLQQQLFGTEVVPILDNDGYLSPESIDQIKQITRQLRAKDTTLEKLTGVSLDTWNNWLYRKRPPSGPSLAFLTLFLTQPEKALRTFQQMGKTNEIILSTVNQ
jgi:DNA-binding transcriptional regulator YiaG